MSIFRTVKGRTSTGDAIPFYHDGTYHIFSLTPPDGTTVYPARLRTSYSHSISTDLVNWTDVETALWPGEGDEPDACGVWTGCAMYGEGRYHIFYTGYNYKIEDQQTICHATSDDGLHWTKDPSNPVIRPDPERYERIDFRDPYCFYNEDEGRYWMLVSGRLIEGPPTKTGCVILYVSDDLKNWEHRGPLYTPYHTNCPECPEMWKMGDLWYLSYSRFSEFGNTIYRISDTPYGPWRTPSRDGIGGRRFYAAKSLVNDEGRRFYFAWIHDRADSSNFGEWYWGGQFLIPHEVRQNEDGELDVLMPHELIEEMTKKISTAYRPVLGQHGSPSEKVQRLDGLSSLAYGFFETREPRFYFHAKVRVEEIYDSFGILLKSNDDISQRIELIFERGMQRVSLLNLPMAADPFWQQSCTNIGTPKDAGPDGVRVAERPFEVYPGQLIDLKLVIDHDLIEIFVDEQAAFSYRYYGDVDHEIGLFAQDSKITVFDIEMFELV